MEECQVYEHEHSRGKLAHFSSDETIGKFNIVELLPFKCSILEEEGFNGDFLDSLEFAGTAPQVLIKDTNFEDQISGQFLEFIF